MIEAVEKHQKDLERKKRLYGGGGEKSKSPRVRAKEKEEAREREENKDFGGNMTIDGRDEK